MRHWLGCLAGCLLGGAATAAAFDFPQLQQLATSGRVHSIEQLIEALPAALRSHYTLVFASRSLQGASPAEPRVILFGDDATLVVTFNGDASQRGYDALETMEFDPAADSFRFREIRFPRPDAVADISEANPARCAACHGNPARPIWDTAPLWPGVYGERYHAGLSAAEAAGIAAFLKLQPGHPRYRWLLGAYTMAERDTYVPDSRAVYENAGTEPPNARLSLLLSTQNVRSILVQMAARPGFEAHRYVLLAAAGRGCGAVENFYPERGRAVLAAARRDFDRDSAAAAVLQAAGKTLRRTSGGPVHAGGAVPDGLDDLRFVAQNGLGLDTRRWTLAFERGSHDLSAPAGALTLEAALFEWVAVRDPPLRDALAYRGIDGSDHYCEQLRQASRRALESWQPAAAVAQPAGPGELAAPGQPAAPGSVRALLEGCADCHTGEIGPPIPFADRAALSQTLLHGGYRRGRLLDEILYRLEPQSGTDAMPRGTVISAEERRELEQYFLAVAVGETPSRP